MLAIELKQIPLKETWTKAAPTQRARSTFPLLGSGENTTTSTVYFELEPGHELGAHTDSAEEILFITHGRVEVSVGDERGIVEGPALAVVPRMVKHNLANRGTGTAKIMGFFPSRYLVATFDNEWQPDGTRVIDTAMIEEMMAGQAAE